MISGILLGFIPNQRRRRFWFLILSMSIILLCILGAYIVEALRQ
jgi:hypothetical protein